MVPQKIIDYETGRDNNFNLIRLIAASAVLVSHAWPITMGGGTKEPFQSLTGYSAGGLAVLLFFAMSGFLVSASADRAKSVLDYFAARGLRIFPGLAVSLFCVAFILGPLVSNLGPLGYFSRSEPWVFVFRGLSLYDPMWGLPGVFSDNPYPSVEASIWTLIYEAAFYCVVGGILALGLLRRKRLFGLLLVALLLWWLIVATQGAAHSKWFGNAHRLSLPFILGSAAWLWRKYIPLSGLLAVALLLGAFAVHRSSWAYPALMVAMTYGVLCLAYIPNGWVRKYNIVGDYSYGLYIYAFPIQGLTVFLLGPHTPYLNIAVSFPLTLVCAVLSWHFVERPSLMWRGRMMGRKPITNPKPT